MHICICTSCNPKILFVLIVESYYSFFFFVIECNLRVRVINAKGDGIGSRTNREIEVYFEIHRGTLLYQIMIYDHSLNDVSSSILYKNVLQRIY